MLHRLQPPTPCLEQMAPKEVPFEALPQNGNTLDSVNGASIPLHFENRNHYECKAPEDSPQFSALLCLEVLSLAGVGNQISGISGSKSNNDQSVVGAENNFWRCDQVKDCFDLDEVIESALWYEQNGQFEAVRSMLTWYKQNNHFQFLRRIISRVQTIKEGGKPMVGEEMEEEEAAVSDHHFEEFMNLLKHPIGFQRMNNQEKLLDNESNKDEYSAVEASLVSQPQSKVAVFSHSKSRKHFDGGSPSKVETTAHDLPHDVVEKMIAFMPFPEILQGRFLNNYWYCNFSATPESTIFHELVQTKRSTWKRFCPIVLNLKEDCMIGFDGEENLWHVMAMGLRKKKESMKWLLTDKLRGVGCLMCGLHNQSKIFIFNSFTLAWKCLPDSPHTDYPKFTNVIHLLPVGSDPDAYQVLIITKPNQLPRTKELCCQVYDSRTQTWDMKLSLGKPAFSCCSSAYLDGVLYVMEYDYDKMRLESYNVEEAEWTKILHPFSLMLDEIETYELLICGNQVMVVLKLREQPLPWYKDEEDPPDYKTVHHTLSVFQLDPASLDIEEICRGPPQSSDASSTFFACDNECIYFGDPHDNSNPFIKYNVTSREWSYLPVQAFSKSGDIEDPDFAPLKLGSFIYEPGLNTFTL